MASEKKIIEGNECIKNAEKYLKTSFMKRSADYDSAALEYSKAATCFKTAKVLGQCRDCHLKAADCYSQNKSYFSAAKSFEQAALVSRDMNEMMQAVDLIRKACQLFREHGTPDTAALSLEKGAKMVEAKHPEVALDLYKQAAEVAMIEDKCTQAAEFVAKAARLQVKMKMFDEAADMLKKEMEYTLASNNTRAAGRLVVAQVLVHLMREDYVAADKAFKEGYDYCERDECYSISNILEGYDQGDPEQMNKGLNSPFIKHMDVEYARLARSLLAETDADKTKAAGNDADDEFAGGLC